MSGIGGWAGLGVGAVAVAMLGALPAQAAVRQCTTRPTIATGEDAASEAAARKQALGRWVAEAAKIGGTAWTSWRLATSRDLNCQKRAEGGFACRAVAMPCMIMQNPDVLPKITPKDKPTKPQQDAAALLRGQGLPSSRMLEGIVPKVRASSTTRPSNFTRSVNLSRSQSG